ncbi:MULTISPECIES: RNA pseudouridine synthase [Ramlibacter]|uniref:Dual-specificity RNA pseudouridine synthase RluF n=1 Tax=Ramlibacter aquaticus TaxID=2780094 RepID=A0ABR9SC44_9BURK|nr:MULTISPECIES: RNA pseudouridine synthase [Ramlibacter]MBE7939903.1 RNA-binding protein [Ramlibacter aquaticus]
MSDEPLRLSKRVAALVPCSRREAEQYIAGGWVRVAGQVVREPQFRVGDEVVQVDPAARLGRPMPATFLVHQPPGLGLAALHALLVPAAQWQADPARVPRSRAQDAGLEALLPLPAAAEGLAVFSQDPRIVRKLQEEAHLVEQELVAHVAGTLAPGGLERLGRGLSIDGKPLPTARVSWQSDQRLRIAAKGLPLDRMAWMCEQVGLQLLSLKRIRIGRLPMAGLPRGQWRYLAPDERF